MFRAIILTIILAGCQSQTTSVNVRSPAPEWADEIVIAGCHYDPDDDECRCLELREGEVRQRTFPGACPSRCP